MAHYAFLDDNNVVTEVIAGRNENESAAGITDWEAYYGSMRGQVCKRASYNTHQGEHVLGGTPFRKNFPAVGYRYDADRDAFIPPGPEFPSWVLDETSCVWVAPVAEPESDGVYNWDEASQSWQEVTDGL